MKLWPCLLFLSASAVAATDGTWLDDDVVERAKAVNEGELVFLTEPPAKPAHHHANRLGVTAASLRDGWVELKQCHSHLDAVPVAEIVFRPGRTRNLTVVSYRNIGTVFVDQTSVQLRDVQRGAKLCLGAETQALHLLGDGLYELRNGPYMRRFLDGYYPMRVTLDIRYPASIELVDFLPQTQPGFEMRREPQRLVFDAWFEGRLQTQLRFAQREKESP